MQELTSILTQYVSPGLVFAIPFLIVIGSMLKKSNRVEDTLIPTILSLIGIPVALIVSLAENVEPMSAIQIIVWLIVGIGQGVFIGAAAVGLHQFIKQHSEYQSLKRWTLENELKKTLDRKSDEEFMEKLNNKGDIL